MDFSNLNASKEKLKGDYLGTMAYEGAQNKVYRMGLNSILGTAGATAYGIALAYPNEINKFFQCSVMVLRGGLFHKYKF